MIQDIAPHTYHNEYKPSAPDKNSFILAYEKGSILLPHQEREADIYFPRFQNLEEKVSDLYSKYIYLFSIDDQRFYLIPELDTTLLPDYEFQDIRNLRTARPQHLAFAGVTGHQLFQWYSKRRFCGCCGKPMLHSQKERMTMKNKKPVWEKHCTHCMACICYCPAEAIEYGRKSVGKPRYCFENLGLEKYDYSNPLK